MRMRIRCYVWWTCLQRSWYKHWRLFVSFFFCLHCHIAFLTFSGVCSKTQYNEKLISMQLNKPELRGSWWENKSWTCLAHILSLPHLQLLTVTLSVSYLSTSSPTTLSCHHITPLPHQPHCHITTSHFYLITHTHFPPPSPLTSTPQHAFCKYATFKNQAVKVYFTAHGECCHHPCGLMAGESCTFSNQ
jgi:hypothetical protein